jgi:hypothetical protein
MPDYATDLASHFLTKRDFVSLPDIDMEHLRHLKFQALSSNSIHISLTAMTTDTVATSSNGHSFTAC